MRYISGVHRDQISLFAEALNEYMIEHAEVRFIDAFVNTLDLSALHFTKAQTKTTGRKPHHPGDLLKLYIYGYLNGIPSSRRLEQEPRGNVEVM